MTERQAIKDIKECPAHALHIFATNKEVDMHNTNTLAAFHEDAIEVPARDFFRDPSDGWMVESGGFTRKKRDLPDTITNVVGVCVMVFRNLDIEDGNVNGAFATICQWTPTHRCNFNNPNPNAGHRSRKKHKDVVCALVYVEIK